MSLNQILKGAEAEGKEKHVPFIETVERKSGGYKVKVVVGKEVPHPNTGEHHIAWIELYGVKEDNQVVTIGRTDFSPIHSSPNTRWHIDLKEFKSFYALAYCNIHGLWQNSVEVS